MHDWARGLKDKTDAGAMLFWDGELWENPVWTITDRMICFTSGNTTQMLLEPGDKPDEAEFEIRGRLRVLMDA
jgi:hypothetical protein